MIAALYAPMNISRDQVMVHWEYFLSLDRDFALIRNYVQINEANFETYSFEFSKIIQLACSETDSVCRILCALVDPSTDYFDESNFRGNIKDYRRVLLKEYPKLTLAEAFVPGLPHRFQPWADWKESDSPSWWLAHNKVKHYRHSSFEQANLHNALYSMSALMLLILYLCRRVVNTPKANPLPAPVVFDSDYASPRLHTAAELELPDFSDGV